MAIPVVETTAISNQTSNASSKTDVTSPSGVLADDIVLIFIAIDGDAANPEANADGFATLTSFPEGADEIYVLWKRSTGSEPANYTVNWTGNEQARFMTVRVSGCVTSGDPWDVISSGVSNSATTTNVISRLTSTVIDTLALYAVAVDRNRVDATDTITGTGWTEVGISGSSGGANGAGLIVGENDMPSIEQVEAGTFGTWASDQNASRGFNLKGVVGLGPFSIDEVIGITEASNSHLKLNISETVGITESVNRFLHRIVNETVGITESVNKALRKIVNEIVGVTEASNNFYHFVISETVGITESTTNFLKLVKNETIGIIESVNKALRKIVNETVGITESRNIHLKLVKTETVGITDTVIKQLGAVGDLLALESAPDVLLKEGSGSIVLEGLGIRKIVNETVGITESTTNFLKLVISENVGITESTTNFLKLVKNEVFDLEQFV